MSDYLAKNVRIHESFYSNRLNNERRLTVVLPPEYSGGCGPYPVIYMQDGQNLFNPKRSLIGETWQADKTAHRLISRKRVEPFILVGIDNDEDNRQEEYTLKIDQTRERGGKGEEYLQFLVKKVKPFINKKYNASREPSHNAIIGSSLGGLFALYASWKRPDIFDRCGALSPALWWAERNLLNKLRKNPEPLKEGLFWIDMGTKEEIQCPEMKQGVQLIKKLDKLLKETGKVPGKEYVVKIISEAEHNEIYWRKRLNKVLCFLLNISSARPGSS